MLRPRHFKPGLPTACAGLSARRWPRARSAGERGFTLIEVVVACILLMVVLGMVTGVLIESFRTTGRTMSHRKAERLVRHTADLMGIDMRSARSHERSFAKLREPGALRQGVMFGTAVKDTFGNGGNLDIADVKFAGPQRFTFLTDVRGNDDAECVHYNVDNAASGAPDWVINRYVSDYSGTCPFPGAGAVRRVLLPRQDGVYSPRPAAIFTYELVCNRTMCPGAPAQAGHVCEPWYLTSVNGVRLNWISGVQVDLSALVHRGDADGAAAGKLKVALRTRQNHDYLFAIGCEI